MGEGAGLGAVGFWGGARSGGWMAAWLDGVAAWLGLLVVGWRVPPVARDLCTAWQSCVIERVVVYLEGCKSVSFQQGEEADALRYSVQSTP